MTLTIPEATPSLNASSGEHWTARHRRRTHWAWLVRIAKLEAVQAGGGSAAPWGSECLTRASVKVERYGRRKLDYDNFVAGCKALIDSLVTEGLIEDDSPEHVSVVYEQHAAVGGAEKMVVTIS
jgi:hypothetical protein